MIGGLDFPGNGIKPGLPWVSKSRTMKKQINDSNNWDWWHFEFRPFLTALSGSLYLKPAALREVADLPSGPSFSHRLPPV